MSLYVLMRKSLPDDQTYVHVYVGIKVEIGWRERGNKNCRRNTDEYKSENAFHNPWVLHSSVTAEKMNIPSYLRSILFISYELHAFILICFTRNILKVEHLFLETDFFVNIKSIWWKKYKMNIVIVFWTFEFLNVIFIPIHRTNFVNSELLKVNIYFKNYLRYM